MSKLLHILTKPDDTLSAEIIEAQRGHSGQQIKVVDLTNADPNYSDLLKEIFTADSVQVW